MAIASCLWARQKVEAINMIHLIRRMRLQTAFFLVESEIKASEGWNFNIFSSVNIIKATRDAHC